MVPGFIVCLLDVPVPLHRKEQPATPHDWDIQYKGLLSDGRTPVVDNGAVEDYDLSGAEATHSSVLRYCDLT